MLNSFRAENTTADELVVLLHSAFLRQQERRAISYIKNLTNIDVKLAIHRYVKYATKEETFGADPSVVIGSINREVCFKKLVLGANKLSYSEGIPDSRTLSRFRDWIFGKIGYTVSSHKHDLKNITLAILTKNLVGSTTPRYIKNIPEIIEMVKKHFPLVTIIQPNWEGMPLLEQIDYVQRSNIVLSLPGSDLMNSLFLVS